MTLTRTLSALAVVAMTLAGAGNALAGDPVHGPGSSHNPIIVKKVHGIGSSHDPIVCVRGVIPGTLDCRHEGGAR